MTVTALTITINDTAYNILDESFDLPDKIEERSKCSFTVFDANGSYTFSKGQKVTVTDLLEGLLFEGRIHDINRHKGSDDVGTVVYHDIECSDKTAILDEKTSNELYESQYAGAIAVREIKDNWVDGITANFAIDVDDSQADFAEGTHSGTRAAPNVEDGNLELALAGAKTTILENTTTIFNTGTLTGVTAASNTLAPTSFKAIRMVCEETGLGQSNTYTYVKIWKPTGTFTVLADRYLFYTVWISNDCPEKKFGVDMVCTDGTSLRDSSTEEFSQNNLNAHPATDLDGYANGKWYGRTFKLTALVGKNLSHLALACEGDKPGVYTAWFGPIMYLDASFALNQYFFQNSFNHNPPQQIGNQGFASTKLTIVDAYDCASANRVSPAYNISQVGIAKDSFVTWKDTKPEETDLTISYSLDNGNSYIDCANNAALPSFPAGLSLASKTIKFLQTFTQSRDASPESKPILSSLQLVINPSYTASKTDVTLSATTTTEWNTSSTHTDTQAANNLLQLIGAQRYWDANTSNNELSNTTFYGAGATGPGTTVKHYINKKQVSLEVGINLEARLRLDFVGQVQNGTIEFDAYIDFNDASVGCVYRTTNWSNYDNRHAYVMEYQSPSLKLGRASNTGDGSAGTYTSIATATVNITQQLVHRFKIEFSGSSHKVYIDDVKHIDTTDGTFTAAGYIGLRVRNFSTTDGYINFFNDFGYLKALTGNWLGPSTSLSGAGTYLSSVVTWDDVSLDDQSTDILVESTINGGSSYQTVTNGGSIPNLTAGQSLSGISVRFRITLTTSTATSMPQVRYFVARILGGFSSTGTRTSKALLLDSVVTCGTTLVFWNEIKPSGTVTVATSLDGTNYTNVSNGGAISGLTTQPAPTIDTFNNITSADYTTKNLGSGSTTITYDTPNSRITNTSGASSVNTTYRHDSANFTDGYVEADFDQANNSGLICRATASDSMYALYLYDNDAGGSYALFSIVNNSTYTQIASGSISFVRGTFHKFRLSCVGTTISVLMDGVQLASVTNSAVSGPGKAGMLSNQLLRCYNLRIQPYGENMSGKKIYTRVTLTSTDPTATPQVTDLTTLVTNPDIQAGELIPKADFRQKYKSDNINDVAKQSDFIWNVKSTGSFIFRGRQTEPAPWVLTSPDVLAGSRVENSADLYRNRHTLTGVKDEKSVTQSFPGDGTSTSWTLQYDVVSVSSMTLNGQAVTFGIKGIDTEKDFYYEVGSNSLAQDSSGTVLQKEVDTLFISYTGQFETYVTRDNTGQFAGTISQAAYREQSGLDIPTMTLLNRASQAHTTDSTTDDIDVSLCRQIALDVNITARAGTSPTIQFFIDRKGADGNYFQIWASSVISSAPPQQVIASIGPAAGASNNHSLGTLIRLRWDIGGSGGPSFTFSASILGQVDPGLAGIGVVEAVEDVSDQNLTVAAAQTLGDSRLQKYGVIGRTLHLTTLRTGLAAGQYLNCYVPELGLNDVPMLVTSVDRKQILKTDAGSPSLLYIFECTAVEGPSLGSWSKAFNNMLKG